MMDLRLKMSAALSGLLLFSLLILPATMFAQQQPASEESDHEPSIYADEIAALKELREKEGRDNAIIHYLTAQKIAPKPVMDLPWELLHDLQLHSWSEKARPLLPHIYRWQPALKEIRRGAAIGYAKQVVIRTDEGTITPNFLELQASTKMLVAEARYFESRREYHRAIENYVAAIKMGRDFTQPDALLINQLVGVAAAGIAVTPFQDLVESGKLDRESLHSILTQVAQIEKTWRPITESMDNEFSVTPEQLAMNLEYERKAEPSKWRDKNLPILEDAVKHPERIAEETHKLREFEERYLEMLYWQVDLEQYDAERESLLDGFHPYMDTVFSPGPMLEFKVRTLRLLSNLRLVRLAAAMELYRMDHDAAPRTLDQLVPKYLDSIPVDPFTGKPMRYRPWTDEGGGAIYSLGPDREDNRMKIEYDGTNGTFTKGDVFLQHR